MFDLEKFRRPPLRLGGLCGLENFRVWDSGRVAQVAEKVLCTDVLRVGIRQNFPDCKNL